MTVRFNSPAIPGVLVMAGLLVGCQSSTVPVSDVAAARGLLSEVLEAWKDQRSPSDLRQMNPPIYVADELWTSPFQLNDFTIDGPGEVHGTNVRLRVTLRGVTPRGKSVTHQVKYLVSTAPARTIAREDR